MFRRLSLITLVSVYFLILVGGIVRSTGSGMGCPDWPKCFGSWVPPTSVEQLPANYKEIYAQQRAEKNTRFTAYLDALGFVQLAEQIRNDESILVEANFNAIKTWTEYINRLIGVVVGFLIFATFLVSISYIGTDNKLFLYALLSLISVGFQGWIGSVVVSTNLLQWLITVHMLLALVIVALLTYLVVRVKKESVLALITTYSTSASITLLLLIAMSVAQVVLGTQVRESVDLVAEQMNYESRESWIEQLGIVFYIHRSYSMLIVLVHIFLLYKVVKHYGNQGNLMRNSLVLLIVVVLEILSGVVMAYFAIPRFAQPIHLLFASLVFGLQLYIWLKINMVRWNKSFRFEQNEVIQNDSYQVYS
ncbi:COX15/CtaA family protein [Catalinimonas niigatensis]|uniref:COX15/CtaA family protein n=1 Tax=Catalinimonas niigatensis TaxID=1397264 RepID=UPI002665BA84|nr:COX15/CtaA family protein [Catalinimonas niigatensis]WPP51511.1 COX15/CtaA family protein [Catalinimonas niigatensis]